MAKRNKLPITPFGEVLEKISEDKNWGQRMMAEHLKEHGMLGGATHENYRSLIRSIPTSIHMVVSMNAFPEYADELQRAALVTGSLFLDPESPLDPES